MDNSTLILIARDIADIKWVVGAILFVIVLGVIAITFLILAVNKQSVEKEKLDDFYYKARQLLDKEDMESLIEFCTEKLKKEPGHSYGRWFLGLAYYRKKDWPNALSEFERLYEIEPSWREEYLNPYLYDIKDRIKHFKLHVTE
jgi:cytochrome c-type biogenesis protein CcmH/NrfG